MKELIESTKRLQGEIDKCISNLIHARQYHDKIEEAGGSPCSALKATKIVIRKQSGTTK